MDPAPRRRRHLPWSARRRARKLRHPSKSAEGVMTRWLRRFAWLVLPISLGACAPKAPPGPSAAEVAQANMEQLAAKDQAVNQECLDKLRNHQIGTNRSYV